MKNCIEINGIKYSCFKIETHPAPLLLILSETGGFLMCGLLDMQAADSLKASAAKVKNVENFEDMLHASVVEVSQTAYGNGARVGMCGKDILPYL